MNYRTQIKLHSADEFWSQTVPRPLGRNCPYPTKHKLAYQLPAFAVTLMFTIVGVVAYKLKSLTGSFFWFGFWMLAMTAVPVMLLGVLGGAYRLRVFQYGIRVRANCMGWDILQGKRGPVNRLTFQTQTGEYGFLAMGRMQYLVDNHMSEWDGSLIECRRSTYWIVAGIPLLLHKRHPPNAIG